MRSSQGTTIWSFAEAVSLSGTSVSGTPSERPSNMERVELWVSLAALAVVSLLVVRAWSLHGTMEMSANEQSLISHSEKVLSLAQFEGQLLDRTDYLSQLYIATGDPTRLRGAATAVSSMGVVVIQLEDLLKDNDSQERHAHELEAAVRNLRAAANMENATHRAPEHEVLDARAVLGLLQAEERGLLEDRTAKFKTDSFRSYVWALVFLGGALAIMGSMFWMIVRDTRRRRLMEENLLTAKDDLEATVSALRLRAKESELMVNTRDDLQLCVTAAQGHATVVRHLELLLPGTSGAIMEINNSRRLVQMAASWGDVSEMQDGFNPEDCCGLRAGKPRWRKPGKSELHCPHFAGEAPENYLCVPLAAHGETLGFLYVGCRTAEALAIAEARTPLILEVAELASMSIASLNLRSKLELQSIRDALTGLFNRRFMEIALERELHRAVRQRTTLAVAILDVDHFKRLNDLFGHETGDVVLREVAECFRKTFRQEDVICRFGGEEFVVIMPDAPEESALLRLDKMRASVEKLQTFVRGQMIQSVTVSAGVAMFPVDGRDGKTLLEAADAALYRAKHGGRNRVEKALAG